MRHCFSKCSSLLLKGVPKYVTPHYEAARMESVRSAIEKTKTFLTFDQFNWWKDFLENPDQYVNRQLVWPLLKLKKVNRVLDIPKVPESTQPSCINSMIVAEGVVREVSIIYVFMLLQCVADFLNLQNLHILDSLFYVVTLILYIISILLSLMFIIQTRNCMLSISQLVSTTYLT